MSLEPQWDPDRLATLSGEQLKIERTKLLKYLEHIDIIEHNAKNDKGKTAYIEDLWNTNNHIIELLHKLHSTPRLDPAEKLPPEIFRTIIIEAVTNIYMAPEKTNNSLILTLVSERWREIILGIPEIWNEILVSVQHEDCASKFVLFLELSTPLPIHLVIHDWQVGNLNILPALFQCRDRITKLTVPLGYELWPQARAQAALNALAQLSPLRNLKYLFFVGINEPNQFVCQEIFKHFNTLHEIPGLVITPDLFRHKSIRQLRVATIQGDLDLLNIVHASMPMLNAVVFDKISLSGGPGSELIDNLNTTQIDESHLPWSSLSCLDHSPSMPAAMHHAMHRLVNLSQLDLTLSFLQLRAILTVIGHLSVLETLCLRLITIPGAQIEEFSTKEIHPNLHVKSLEFDTLDFDFDEEVDDYQMNFNINEALLKAIPAIETVELLYPLGLESHGCYDWRGFTKLKTIYLKKWDGDGVEVKYELPLSLSTVSLEITHERFSDLLSSKVTHLTFEPVSDVELDISIYAREWPELRSFATSVPFQLYGQDLKFTHLKIITVSDSNSSRSLPEDPYYDDIMNATRLCIQIAMNPEDLPSLEDLEMMSSPHWDILLLMLKKRNFTNKGKFVPLKTLRIPTAPKELETVLWSLMNGMIPKWPSLYDISLHGVLELLEEDSV
jgi:hypothetical protein